jgi:predicted  nucleic acid-binding Zn-ribbon protein
MKYNNALMTINQLNEEKEKHDSHINELNDKIKKNAEKYELFKTQIIKEYKNIQNDFSLTKKERDLLKGTLIDFKNYFMKYIGDDGELIEVRKEQ